MVLKFFLIYSVLKKFNVEITADNYDKQLDTEAMQMFENWMFNGGITTSRDFSKLERTTRNDILEYLEEFSLYEELKVNKKRFVLVHGGLSGFDEKKPLDEYSMHDMIWGRCDYTKKYYPDKYLVTGHTPTNIIDSDYKGKVYIKNNHIAIDCGAVYGNRLGCICLDTWEEFYV